MSLKVLSLNICCPNRWDDKSSRLKSIVDSETPDILCLQEVALNISEDTPKNNQLHKINKMFKATYYHGALTHPYFPGGERAHQDCYHGPGFFILNPELKVISTEDITIFKGEGREYKNTACRLSYKGKSIVVLNVHLSAEHRETETDITLKWINDNTDDDDSLIVCGDFNSFNCKTGKDVDSRFREQFSDAWQDLNSEEIGETYFGVNWWKQNYPDHETTKKFIKKNAEFGSNRLDYVFYRGLKPISIEIIDTGIPVLTDHAGLSTEFDI